jgi:hypothetical protein
MKKFTTVEEMVEFCKNDGTLTQKMRSKYCLLNKKNLTKQLSEIHLKKAGYSNLTGDINKIYKELSDYSARNSFNPGNSQFLNARNEGIKKNIEEDGSDELIDFLRKNGITDIKRQKIPKAEVRKLTGLPKAKATSELETVIFQKNN